MHKHSIVFPQSVVRGFGHTGKIVFMLVGALLLGFLFIGFSFAASPGDVIINELVSNGSEWVELLNTTDSPISLIGWTIKDFANLPKSLSGLGIIPAHGIVVFEHEPGWLNDDPDTETITLFDDTDTPIHSISYGSNPGAGVATPAEGESAAFDVDTQTWSIGELSKGWFNDAGEPGKAPLLSKIASLLEEDGISSNIDELDNPSATPTAEDDDDLYFSNEEGKIVFEQTLNLTDQAAVVVLQSLGEKMDMSEGFVAFDSETADALTATGAKIYMYGLDELGFTSTPNLSVKDDEGNVIDPEDENYPTIESEYDEENGTLTFTVSHFTQFEVDDNVYVSSANGDDDNNDGTKESPYQTIQKGIDSVPIGGTVNVAAGEYDIEGIIVDKKNVSIIGPGIGEDVERAYVVADDCAGSPDAAFHLHADGIMLQGLDIDGDGCEHVVHIGDLSEIQVNSVTVSGNAIHRGNNGATLSWGSSNVSTSPNVVSENKIYGNDVGVLIESAFDNIIEKNNIFENEDNGIELSLCDDCDLGSPNGNIIRENTITKNEGHGIYAGRDGVIIGDLDILDNTISENSGGSGIYLNQVGENPNTLTISSNTINANDSYGIYLGRINGNSVVIKENTIIDNSSVGVYLSGDSGGIFNSTVSLQENTISDNDREGVYIERVDQASTLGVIGNTITGSGEDDDNDGDGYAGVYINNVFASSTVTFLDNAISGNSGQGVYVCGEGKCSSSTLTFEGNTINDNEGSGLKVYELFSSTLDVLRNTVKGNGGRRSDDTNAGLELWYVGESEEEGEASPSTVTVSKNTFDGNYYGIYINQTDDDSVVTIGKDNIVKNNSDAGVYLRSSVSGVTITNNTIQNNGIENGTTGIVILSASGNKAHNNTISGNGDFGVSNQDEDEGDVFDAERNWWGDVTGPLHDIQNPDGKGNAVSNNVIFNPWYINSGRTILSSAVIGSNTVSATGGKDVALNSDNSGQADLPEGITNLVLNDDSNLDLSGGLVDDAVTLQSGVEGEPVVLSNSDLEDITASITDGTLITGPAGWDGIIQPPAAGTPDGNAPAGFSVGDTVINVGSPDGTLVFDKPVTILLAGITSAVGYRPAGSDTWVQITNVCGGTYANPEAPIAPGECYISNGTDIKIVTFHFTSFGVLNPTPTPTPTPAPTPSGGGGNGGGDWTPPFPTEPAGGFKFFITPDTTTTGVITLNFDGGPDAKTIAIADNLNFSPATYINYSTSAEWTLSGAFGEKTLYVKFANQYVQYSKAISDTVMYAPKEISQPPASTPQISQGSALPAPAPTPLVSEPREETPTVQITQTEQETPIAQEPLTALTAPQSLMSQLSQSNKLVAAIGNVVTLGTDSVIVGLLITVLVLILAGYTIYTIIRRVRRKNL